MKRSIIALAAILMIAASTAYAHPPRRPRRAHAPRFWVSMLCWLGHDHYDGCGHYAPGYEYGHLPPGHHGRPHYDRGWHRGWRHGRHYGWDRHGHDRGWDPDCDEPGDGERGGREHGRGHGQGNGRGGHRGRG